MIVPTLVAAAIGLANLQPAEAARLIGETDHALAQDRFDQARILLDQAAAAGATPDQSEPRRAALAYATGDWTSAYGLYRGLIARGLVDPEMQARAGHVALELGRLDEAATWLDAALAAPGPAREARWFDLRGVVADKQGDRARADAAYARGAGLAPGDARLLNNWGASMLLRGRWAEAEALLARAVAADASHAKARANLDFARAAMADRIPDQRTGESRGDYARRLNDAGVAAALAGDRARARAAFTAALAASSTHYERAAKNLERLGPQ